MKSLKIPVAATLCSMGMCTAFSGCETLKSTESKKVTSPTTKEPSMQTTASGLTYQILEQASDAQAQTPGRGDRVTVHYTGWLHDETKVEAKGEKFDSSVDRGQPFTFMLGIGQVIKGWDEGVAGMKVGEKRRLIIPASLGYGTRGAGSKIPGGATLVFDVTLLNINNK